MNAGALCNQNAILKAFVAPPLNAKRTLHPKDKYAAPYLNRFEMVHIPGFMIKDILFVSPSEHRQQKFSSCIQDLVTSASAL